MFERAPHFPHLRHLAHNMALLQFMLGRAALYKCNQAQNDASIDHQNAINLFSEACKLGKQAAYERKAEIIAAYKPHKDGMTQQQFTQRIHELLPP